MTDTVTILGGPQHGKRIGVHNLRGDLQMHEAPRWGPFWREPPDAEVPMPGALTFPIITLPVRPGREIKAAVHPDITRDTGVRLLGDLVYAAWSQYDVGGKR